MERLQYKKAMDEYNASLAEADSVDGPSAKQAKTAEIKDNLAPTNPIPGTLNDVMISGAKKYPSALISSIWTVISLESTNRKTSNFL